MPMAAAAEGGEDSHLEDGFFLFSEQDGS